MIFLVQFGVDGHLYIFQRPQIALALRTHAIFLVVEKFTRAYLFQTALEILWLLIRITYVYILPLLLLFLLLFLSLIINLIFYLQVSRITKDFLV